MANDAHIIVNGELSDSAKHFPALSVMVKLRETVDLTDIEKVALSNWEKRLLELCTAEGSYPSPAWVAELVSLAVTVNERLYHRILSSYLTLLSKHLPIIKGYHIVGIADLLRLALHDDWLSLNEWHQVITLLETKTNLFTVESKNVFELRDTVVLWEALLSSLVRTKVVIEGELQDRIGKVLSSCDARFKSEKDKIGRWSVKMARQSLFRIISDKPSEWWRAGTYLFSACKNGAMAASAIAISTTNYGVSSPGAIPPLVDMVVDLGSAAVVAGGIIRSKWQVKEWYEELQNLNGMLITTSYKAAKAIERNATVASSSEMQAFADVMKLLVTVKGRKKEDKIKAQEIAYGLRETLIGILKSFPGNKYDFIHQNVFSLINHFLHLAKDPYLMAVYWGDIAALLSEESGLNLSYLALCANLIQSNPEGFEKMPATSSFFDGVDALYHVLELQRRAEKPEEDRMMMYWLLQAAIDTRLETMVLGCLKEKNKDVGVKLLTTIESLIQDEIISHKINLKSIENKLKGTAEESWIAEARHKALALKNQQNKTAPPLALAVWFSLQEQKNDVTTIITLLARAGEPTALLMWGQEAERTVAAKQDQILSTIGSIGTLSIGVFIDRGGVNWTDKPTNEEEAKAMVYVIKEVQKVPYDTMPLRLADEVGTSFIAYHVKGLLQGSNLNTKLIQAAIDLANRAFEAGQGLQQPGALPAAWEASLAEQAPVAHAQKTLEPPLPSISHKQKGPTFWVKLDVDDFDATIGSKIEEIARGNRGLGSRTYYVDHKTTLDNKTGEVRKIAFKGIQGVKEFYKEVEKQLPEAVEAVKRPGR